MTPFLTIHAIPKGKNSGKITTEDITTVLNSNTTVVTTTITEDIVTNRGLQKICDNAKEGGIFIVRRKICCYKECDKSSDDFQIINHACHDHIDEVRERNNIKRKEHCHIEKGVINANFDYDSRRFAMDINFENNFLLT